MSSEPSSPGRRLTPEARRRHLVETARALLEARPEEPISTADVAAAAGVTRALVHHYFSGIDELRQAVALDIARSLAGTLAPRPAAGVAERVHANVVAYLDALEGNHAAWLATIGRDGDDAAVTPAGRALRQGILERMIANNSEIIRDTPWARLCLTGYIAFSDAVCRQWARGHNTREEAERALTDTLMHLLLQTIPDGEPLIRHPSVRTKGAKKRGSDATDRRSL